jgi:hypothetical protein
MAGESGTQGVAVITSPVAGALLGLATGVTLAYRVGGAIGECGFVGFGFAGGLLAGCAAASLFAWLLKPGDPGGPEADYDEPAPPVG